MLYQRTGYPEENEILLCTITKIFPHGAFARLDEFGKSGMIHISEISPGRIRNINDYVRVDKKVVCKVLRINEEKGYIDLSLRRVNDTQRRLKINEIKQEQKAEKIIEYVAGRLKLKTEDLYETVFRAVEEEYGALHAAFEDVVINDLDLKTLGIDKKIADELEPVIRQRIKPPEVTIKGEMKLMSFDPDGLSIIKDALMKADKVSDQVTITYEGGGKYRVVIVAPEYKEAEDILEKTTSTAEKIMKKHDGIYAFARIDK